MKYVLDLFQTKLLFFIFFSLIAGLAFTRMTGGYDFTPAICLLAALVMIYPSLVPLEFDRLSSIFMHKKNLLITFLANFLISPLLAVAIGKLILPNDPSLWLGLILLSVLPGGGMVTTWAYRSKADMPLTVSIVFANLALAILISPFYLSYAMNLMDSFSIKTDAQSCTASQVTGGAFNCSFGSGGVNPISIAIPLLVIVVLPLILAFITQKILRSKYNEEEFSSIKRNFAAISNIGMAVVLFLLMGIKENAIIFDQPLVLIKAVLATSVFYGLMMLLSYSIYRKIGRAEGRAIFWGTYLRYITLALGIAISFVYQDTRFSLAVITVVSAYLVQLPTSFLLAKKMNNPN